MIIYKKYRKIQLLTAPFWEHKNKNIMEFEVKDNRIYCTTNEEDAATIEIAMQNYLNKNPDEGKFGQNEVQRAEYFENENIWAADIF